MKITMENNVLKNFITNQVWFAITISVFDLLLARVNESEERHERAVQLWAAAETLRVRLGAPLEQVAHKYTVATLTRLRARLGDVAFELEWAKGVHMTTEQAIALALS